jgi:hypothetical protein
VVDLFFVETNIRHGVAGCADRQLDQTGVGGPVEALWPMMGQPGRRPWIRQKQVEERERVFENQRVILGVLGRLMFSLREVSLAWLV